MKTSKYTAIYLISNAEAEGTIPKSLWWKAYIEETIEATIGFIGVSTVMYRVLSEQKQLGAKQFESPV